MHTVDEIASLLHIHTKAHEVGNLTNISQAALTRLKQINAEMGPDGFGKTEVGVAAQEGEPDETDPNDTSGSGIQRRL